MSSLGSESTEKLSSREKAELKVVDLSIDRSHLLHGTPAENIPFIFMPQFGIVSHRFASEMLGVKLGEHYQAVAQYLLPDGFNLISLYDPQVREGSTVGSLLSTSKAYNSKKGQYSRDIYLLINGNVRLRPNFFPDQEKTLNAHVDPDEDPEKADIFTDEVFVRGQIPSRFIDGIVVNEAMMLDPIASYIKAILDPIPQKKQSRTDFRLKFLQQFFSNSEIEALKKDFFDSQQEMGELLTSLATMNGFGPTEDVRYFYSYIPWMNGNQFGKPASISESRKLHIPKLFDSVESIDEFGEKVIKLDTLLTANLPQQDLRVELANLGLPPYIVTKMLKNGEEQCAQLKLLLDKRQKMYDTEKQVWGKYIEDTTGKQASESNFGDFVIGVGKKYGIPIYEKKGRVLWPSD